MAARTNKKCPLCKTGTLSFDDPLTRFEHNGKVIWIPVPADYCSDCKEGFLNNAQTKAVDQMIEQLKKAGRF